MAQSLIQIQSILEQYNFDFPNLPDRLKCVICHKILKSAKQTSCGCKVCDKCINNYLSNGPKPCPSKQADCADVILNLKDDINQDNATNKEISNLKVKCPFKSCKYENQLKNMAAHIDICEFREISCDKCGEKFLAKEKANHDRSKCDMRNVNCDFCRQTMTAKTFNKHHMDITHPELCTKLVGVCPYKCPVTGMVCIRKHLLNCVSKELTGHVHGLIHEVGKEEYYKIENCKTFVWIVKHLNKLIEAAKQSKRIYKISNPYFTSKHGYKFALEINLVGVDEKYESHISVQLIITMNDFDCMLSWPFRQRVVLTIIDKNNVCKFMTDLGEPFNRFDGFVRPLDNENAIYGPEKLIPLWNILNNGDNDLYFKISIDMTGISKP